MSDLKKIRTDVVGSLLRPDYLKGAREMVDEGQMDSDELREAEDRAVREAVALQEAAGLEVVTDGEMRRLNFQDSFGASVSGFDAAKADLKFYEAREMVDEGQMDSDELREAEDRAVREAVALQEAAGVH